VGLKRRENGVPISGAPTEPVQADDSQIDHRNS